MFLHECGLAWLSWPFRARGGLRALSLVGEGKAAQSRHAEPDKKRRYRVLLKDTLSQKLACLIPGVQSSTVTGIRLPKPVEGDVS